MKRLGRSLLVLGCALLALLGPASASGPGRSSPAARLSQADSASEYWDVAALFDSGHRVFARLSISNEGPGEETGYAIGQIVFPDGTVVPFTNGRRKGRWQLSDDGLRMEIGSTVLDWRQPERRLEVDKNKAGIKLALRFESSAPEGLAWRSAPTGYAVNLVTANAKVHGTLWARDVIAEPVSVRGTLSATHTSMEQTEMKLAQRRIELHSIVSPQASGAEASVFLLDLTAPDGSRRAWLVAEANGRILVETDELEVRLEGHDSASEQGYPVPERLILSGPRIRGEIALQELLVRHDPLSVAPQPFRWFLSLKTQPSHLWLASRYHLVVQGAPGEAPIELDGSGATSIFFLNPQASGR
jgi:hypothetical protein